MLIIDVLLHDTTRQITNHSGHNAPIIGHPESYGLSRCYNFMSNSHGQGSFGRSSGFREGATGNQRRIGQLYKLLFINNVLIMCHERRFTTPTHLCPAALPISSLLSIIHKTFQA